MKALSIQQPWAQLIVAGLKPIENRTWTTDYRGPLLIHAAQRMSVEIEAVERAFAIKIDRKALHFGAIIGRVELVDIVTHSRSPWFAGPYGFVLRNPRPMHPLPWRGRLNLFEVDLP